MKFELRGDRSSCASLGKMTPTGNRPRLAPSPCDEHVDREFLRELSKTWGERFADVMISDTNWPRCDQEKTIHATKAIVAGAISNIIATLNQSADFRPHTPMMAYLIRAAFDASLSRGPFNLRFENVRNE